MATLHDAASDQCRQVYVKGGVEVVLSQCSGALNPSGETIPLDADEVHRQVEAMAAKGLRVLAFAGKRSAAETDEITHDRRWRVGFLWTAGHD